MRSHMKGRMCKQKLENVRDNMVNMVNQFKAKREYECKGIY